MSSSPKKVLSSRPSDNNLPTTGRSGRQWYDLTPREKEENARYIIKGQTETRRNLNLPLKDRGGRKRRNLKKKTHKRKH